MEAVVAESNYLVTALQMIFFQVIGYLASSTSNELHLFEVFARVARQANVEKKKQMMSFEVIYMHPCC